MLFNGISGCSSMASSWIVPPFGTVCGSETTCVIFLFVVDEPVFVCQNTGAPTLTATGTNLLWYTDPGLTNLVWCRSTAQVLEIFSPNYLNLSFWAIANQVGLEYFYLIGDGQRPPDFVDPYLIEDDIHVPIEKLALSLEILLT